MRQSVQDIYASAPMRSLLADETAAYMPDVRRCAGTRALLLSAAADDAPPNPPYLGQWVTVHMVDGRFKGDICASTEAPLPFIDEAFDLILLRHALEMASMPLDEIVRMLAPGGTLVLTGVSPLSGWTPWWLWRTRGSATHARSPFQLSTHLRRIEVHVQRVQRVGQLLPIASSSLSKAPGWLGGGYVLIARKKGPASAPTRLRPKPVTAPVRAGLAPGARRSSVSQPR